MKNPGVNLFALSLLGYTMAAYVEGWFPFKPDPLPPPTVCISYQVAADISGSNSVRTNWKDQADNFAGHLKSCDKVSFWTVDGGTSTHAQAHETILMPAVDPRAGSFERAAQERQREAVRESIRQQLKTMILQVAPSAEFTDILGLFKQRPAGAWPLSPAASNPVPVDADNSWVIFSDGLESVAPGVNLEGPGHGGSCVTDRTRERLVTSALRVFRRNGQLDGFSAVVFVAPEGAGQTGCNSRHEIGAFWEPVIHALSGDPARPVVRFETNPFSATNPLPKGLVK